MGLQTQNLVMVGLGILEDAPPNQLQPPLVDGIHLRWAFKRELGFPWFGFHLFRRLHRNGDPLWLSHATSGLTTGPWPGDKLSIPPRQISSDQNLLLTDDFPPGGAVEFDLDGRGYLRFTLGDPARWVEVRIGFRNEAKVEVTALLWDTPVVQTLASGMAGDIVTVTLEFDAITDVKLSSGPAALVDLCFIPVSQEATVGWEPVPNFSYPMCLPVTHPDYPCTPGMSEDLARARDLAKSRIRYGDPDQFTLPPVLVDNTGTVSMVSGSPIVTGAGTNWSDKPVGAVLLVDGDSTAYIILMVVAPDKLVLSRSYAGTSGTGKAYAIHDDAFGELHDYLVHLISGGGAAGPMVSRSIPVPVESGGKIRVLNGSQTVMGIGTNWSTDLVGLALQVTEVTTGTIEVFHGSSIVNGTGTVWGSNLAGLTLRIAGEPREYTIASVNSPTQLTLAREYIGTAGNAKAYSIVDRTPYTIATVDSPTQLTIDRGYARATGEFGTEKPYSIVAKLQPTEPGRASPRMPNQYPLQLVMLGTVQPAIAQILGLYWADQRADPGVAYDYLILADNEGRFQGQEPNQIVGHLQQIGFIDLDGYIVFNKKMAPAAKLSPPHDLRVYALTGGARPTKDADLQDASNNAGLRWELGVTEQGVLLPDKPFMYHLWRAALGEEEPSDVPPPDEYQPITKDQPILVALPRLPYGMEPQRPPNWPPFPMHVLDNGLPDGWYGYQVSGVDLFGRHSPNSAPAAWYQWEPVPDPLPWYYQEPPGDRAIHPFAVRLLDKMPPPPPTGIEAYALDPADPTVLRDAAYHAWRETLSSDEQDTVIGLRVRWLWTQAHMRQAPDTREFRIYYHSGQMNALRGRTVNVSAVSDTESDIETDIPNTHPANAYVGARLRIGSDAFAIVASEAGIPLRLRVKSIGPGEKIRPLASASCTIALPLGHPLFLDSSLASNWQERIYVVNFDDHVKVTSDTAGRPLRKYEIFLPAPGDTNRGGLPLLPSLAEPIGYAHIGVSAVDDKTHTLDNPKWDAGDWSGRVGNEGRVGAPAKIFRVLREPPPAPGVPPPDSDKVFATPADYHSHSYYTYRWQPQPHLETHIFRSLDDTLFKVDWKRRGTSTENLSADDEDYFPVEWRGPDPSLVAKRNQLASDLNHLNTFSHDGAGMRQAMAYYRGLSNDALRVLAGLPGNERAFTQLTIQALDPDDPSNANQPGPDNPADFPIDPALRIYIDTLDGRSTNRYFYRAAYVDGAHNRSELSLSSPPVYLPNVVPTRSPVITKVVGGDRRITLKWASNRESDLAEYRVYRADSEEAARDLRLMTLVHTEVVSPGDPAARPAEMTWIDQPVHGLVTFHYRIVAVDEADNVSTPSPPVAARAFDYTPPASPIWERIEWVQLDPQGREHPLTSEPPPGETWKQAVALAWTTQEQHHCLVQRRQDDQDYWQRASGWLEPTDFDNARGVWLCNTYDIEADSLTLLWYRLKVESLAGNLNEDFDERQLSRP